MITILMNELSLPVFKPVVLHIPIAVSTYYQ